MPAKDHRGADLTVATVHWPEDGIQVVGEVVLCEESVQNQRQ